MSNLLNSQIPLNNNIIAAKTLSDKSTGKRETIGEIRAPEFYPRYSLASALKQHDEFAKSIYKENYKKQKSSERKQSLFSFVKTIGFVGIIYLLISKFRLPKKIIEQKS